jgi:A118 family predicted phage portal protein
MVRMVAGDGKETYYQEINPELNTEARIKGINNLLSQIGYKSGFSNGHFVFSETTGFQTATGVEAAQQRTIQTTKDVRDKLESCVKNLVYALNVFADLYTLAPAGTYEIALDFGDITYNRDEDRARWWGYVVAGKVPAWKFFVKFEGMTEDEAKEMVAEAAPKQPKLFALEE